MRSCNEIKESISLYIDNELSIEDRLKFEEHVAVCPDCKSDLDEIIHIVNMFKDTQEVGLPANFKEELHRKLVDAAREFHAKKAASRKARYIRVFSSIAAGFILIFLFNSIYRHGLSPRFTLGGGSTSNSVMKSSEMAGSRVEDNMAVAPAETAAAAVAGSGSIGSGAEKGELSGEPTIAAAPDVGRSTAYADRFDKAQAADLSREPETANSSTATLTILVDNPADQVEAVKALAIQNGGEEQQKILMKSGAAALTASTDANNEIMLTFTIPNDQYDEFVNSLNTGYGQTNVESGAHVTEDKTSALDGLINESNNIDTEIKKLEEDDPKANTDKIDQLKSELQTVQDEIENIRLNTDFTIVNVTIKKK